MKLSTLKINTSKALNVCIIAYAIAIAVGIVLTCIFGVNLDINFKGGTQISYSYTGSINETDARTVVTEKLGDKASVAFSAAVGGAEQQMKISLAGNSSLETEKLEALTDGLTTKFADNNIALYDSNSVSPNIAGSFFAKSLAAVVLAGALVTVYVGIRFRNIGGVSAAIMAYVALILDCIIAFLACTAFRLPVDSNLIAVILTLLGYSLNDTIVIYDRIREEKKFNPAEDIKSIVDRSINTVKTRTIITTVTTLLAVITVIVVSEVFGLSTLRSFAIPMAFGLVSGCVSSLFVSCPLWAIWVSRHPKKKR